ncbi:TLC domain-containing protein 5 [Linum grandiflorum]
MASTETIVLCNRKIPASSPFKRHCPHATLSVSNPPKMENQIFIIVGGGVLCWTTAFFIAKNIFPKRSLEFCNRLVSTSHAALALSLAILSVDDWTRPVSPLASDSSPYQASQMKTLAVSLSYMIYDLGCCLFERRVDMANAIHHLVSIVGIGAGLAYHRCGTEMVTALWVTEISSPFLHLRELLKELGYRDTQFNFAADIAFAAIFSFARMGFGPYLTYVTLSANNPLIIKAMALGLQLVSAFWFYKIVRMVRYKLAKWSSSSTKKAT